MLYIKSIIFICLCLYSTFTFADEDEVVTTSNNLENSDSDAALSYDFEEKLDIIVESVNVLQQNNEFLMTTIRTMQEELKMLKQDKVKSLTSFAEEDEELNVLEVKCPNNRLPVSCYEVKECKSNIYNIMIPTHSNRSLPVSCDLYTDEGGWTVIQRRKDGSVNFYRNWTEYVEGFGNLNGEFFIGLEKLHLLTTQQPQELYIQLEDFEGEQRYAKYTTFKIDSADNDYKLTVSGYSGNAGDSFSYHNDQKFSTWDHDSSAYNCTKLRTGAWWYKTCNLSNLNGKYLMGQLSKSLHGKGISWGSFRGYDYSLKFSKMMIRPRME